MPGERRTHSRLRVCLPAFLFTGSGEPVTATVTDLSPRGLCVNAPEWDLHVASRDLVSMEAAFFAPGVPWPVVLSCDVRWNRTDEETVEWGCSFSGGDAGSHFALQKFLALEVKRAMP